MARCLQESSHEKGVTREFGATLILARKQHSKGSIHIRGAATQRAGAGTRWFPTGCSLRTLSARRPLEADWLDPSPWATRRISCRIDCREIGGVGECSH